MTTASLHVLGKDAERGKGYLAHGIVHLINTGTPVVRVHITDANEFGMRRINVGHFSRIVKGLVAASHQPSIFVHTHDILVIAINDIFHGKLVIELVGVRVSTSSIDREGDSDKGESILRAVAVSAVMGRCFTGLAVLAVGGAETFGRVALVIVTATG